MNAPADTIFALSSGAPPAAIAIVRVSGPGAASAAETLAGSLPPPRMAALRRFADRGDPIDRGLLLWFPARASVTGEDLAEFHLHGGRAVVARMLDALAAQPGLRLADPGEFSRRAALNGRLTLGEAEALGDLLSAETEVERRAAFSAFDGALGTLIEGWRTRLLALAARVEVMIDYDGEGDVPDDAASAGLAAELASLRASIAQHLDGPTREELRASVMVVLAGPPNSGKSSLLNALAGREVALVTDIPGTTRDLIEVQLVVAGRRLRLVDTAGLREADDPIERLGIERARDAIGAADLRIWLGDDAPPPSPLPTLLLHARCDAPGRRHDPARLAVSAVTGAGLGEVLDWLAGHAAFDVTDVVLNRRQSDGARAIVTELAAASATGDLLLMADHLRHAQSAIDALTGVGGVDDMLDAMFAGFCLGK